MNREEMKQLLIETLTPLLVPIEKQLSINTTAFQELLTGLEGVGSGEDRALSDLARQLNLPEDDPILLVARGNAKLESKVELWSTTIVQLLDLVRSQNEQSAKAAGRSEKLSDSLNQFEKELLDLKTQFKK